MGEVTFPLNIWRGFEISTSFLVSDQAFEPLIGMSWLRMHRCRLGFGTGALFVGRKMPLVKGNGPSCCRRVIVVEKEYSQRKSVPFKTIIAVCLPLLPLGWRRLQRLPWSPCCKSRSRRRYLNDSSRNGKFRINSSSARERSRNFRITSGTDTRRRKKTEDEKIVELDFPTLEQLMVDLLDEVPL